MASPKWAAWLAFFLVLVGVSAGVMAAYVSMSGFSGPPSTAEVRTAKPHKDGIDVRYVEWLPEDEPGHLPGWRTVEEDEPGWDCRTMGNRVCGSDMG